MPHELIPADPEMTQLTAPLGAVALAGPVNVAENVIAPPKVSVPEEVIAMVGATGETVVELVELVATIEK